MSCKCTHTDCNGLCTNPCRNMDLCVECYMLGHNVKQETSFSHNGKVKLKTTDGKIIKTDGTKQ